MKHLCYAVLEKHLESREPIGWCILGSNKIWTGPTLADVKSKALSEFPFAEFLDKAGWVFVGEEEKLLDPQYDDVLFYVAPASKEPSL